MERACKKLSCSSLSGQHNKAFLTMTQNPSDIRIRLGVAQTLCILLYDEDMNKSIQGEGLYSVPCGQNHPSTHNTAPSLKVKSFITEHSEREREHGCDPLIYYVST